MKLLMHIKKHRNKCKNEPELVRSEAARYKSVFSGIHPSPQKIEQICNEICMRHKK